MFGRYGSVGVPILALSALVYGMLLVAVPDDFTAHAYEYAFQWPWSGPRAWGVLFVAAGVLAILWVHWVSVFLLCASVASWGGFLLTAVIAGIAEGPGGWVWPLGFSTATIVAVARKGIRGVE